MKAPELIYCHSALRGFGGRLTAPNVTLYSVPVLQRSLYRYKFLSPGFGLYHTVGNDRVGKPVAEQVDINRRFYRQAERQVKALVLTRRLEQSEPLSHLRYAATPESSIVPLTILTNEPSRGSFPSAASA